MLDAILDTAPGTVLAPALLGGKWLGDGRRPSASVRTPGRRQPRPAAGPRRRPPRPTTPDARPAVAGRSRGHPRRRSSTAPPTPGSRRPRRDRSRLIALELGKPVKDGRGELDRVADTFAVCAAEARQIGGELLPVAGWARGVGNTALTYRAPAGSRWPSPRSTPRRTCSRTSSAPPSRPATPPSSRRRRRRPPFGRDRRAAAGGRRPPVGGPAAARRRRRRRAAVRRPRGRGHQLHRQRRDRRGGGPRRRRQAARPGARRQRRDHRLRRRRRRGRGQRLRPHRVHQLRAELHLGAAGLRPPLPASTSSSTAFGAEVATLRVGDPLDPATDVGSMVDDEAAERVAALGRRGRRRRRPVTAGGTRDGATRRADRSSPTRPPTPPW